MKPLQQESRASHENTLRWRKNCQSRRELIVKKGLRLL
jgi:hypothetical protein